MNDFNSYGYEFGPWKIWNGGECPVAPDVMVQFQMREDSRNEAEDGVKMPAQCLSWAHVDRDCDIIAYRTVKEPVRGELVLYGNDDPRRAWDFCKSYRDTHRIRLPTEDGKIVAGTAIVEELE